MPRWLLQGLGGGEHRGVLGGMFWLGPHVGMTLPFKEEGKCILSGLCPPLGIIHQHPQTSLRCPPVS